MKKESLSPAKSLLPFNEVVAINKQINKRKAKVGWKLIDRCFNKEDLIKPLLEGWKREIVVRGTSHDRKDVYYYSPCRTKLRSAREVEKFLIQKGSSFTRRNFSFAQVIMGFPEPYEVCRNAALRLETKIKTCSPKLLLNQQSKILSAKPRKLSKISSCVNADMLSPQPLGYKLEKYSKCIQKDNEMSSLDFRLPDVKNEAQQKTVLYIEELKEETSPTHSCEPLSTTMFPLEKSSPPKTLHSSLQSTCRRSLHRFPSKKSRNASSAPPVPMFQLKLEDISTSDEKGRDCSNVTQSEDSNLRLDSPVKVPSRIRVRPIEELCRMDNENTKSPPSPLITSTNHLNKAPLNGDKKENYLLHPSSQRFTITPMATAPPPDSSTVVQNNQNKLSNILMAGQQPVFYVPTISPNISVNVHFNVPKSSACSYPQTKANYFLTNPVNQAYGLNLNTRSRFNPSDEILSKNDNSMLLKNAKFAQFGSLYSSQSSPFIIQSNINSDALNHDRSSSTNTKLKNSSFRNSYIANTSQLPYNSKDHILLSLLATQSNQAPHFTKEIGSSKAKSNISYKSPPVKSSTITPSVTKVGSISVDDWLSIQD